jgi:hypothetical protein
MDCFLYYDGIIVMQKTIHNVHLMGERGSGRKKNKKAPESRSGGRLLSCARRDRNACSPDKSTN